MVVFLFVSCCHLGHPPSWPPREENGGSSERAWSGSGYSARSGHARAKLTATVIVPADFRRETAPELTGVERSPSLYSRINLLAFELTSDSCWWRSPAAVVLARGEGSRCSLNHSRSTAALFTME